MKMQNYIVVLIGLILFSFMSCNEDKLLTPDAKSSVEVQTTENGIIYPSSKDFESKKLLTKSSGDTFETNWENWSEITTKGTTIRLPWNTTATSSIPFDMAFDIKKEDGWKMLLHTLTDTADLGLYAIFYNQRTGIMKVFYYAPAKDKSNTATWDLSFSYPQTWMNIGAEVAIPINLGKLESWKCSNAVTPGNKGIQTGWNCFQIPLAYNPNNNGAQYIEITSESLNIGTYDLFGSSYSYSKGTILTHGSKASAVSLVADLASIIGGDAKSWIQDSIPQKSRVIGWAAIIATAGKVLGKLTSSLSSGPSIQDLEFTTRGNFNVQGTLTTPTSNSVKSIRASFTDDKIGKVGAWNLQEQPTVYLDPRADYAPEFPDTDLKEHTFRLRNATKYDYQVVLNPDLQSHVKSQRVEIDFVRYWANPDKVKNFYPEIPDYYTNFGSLGSRTGSGFSTVFTSNEILYGGLLDNKAIFDFPLTNLTFVARNGYQDLHEKNTPVIFIPTASIYGQKFISMEGLYMRMSLYLETEFEGKRETTVSTRTFLPKFEWDPAIYGRYKNASIANGDVNMDDLSGKNEEYQSTVKLIDEQHPGGLIIETN